MTRRTDREIKKEENERRRTRWRGPDDEKPDDEKPTDQNDNWKKGDDEKRIKNELLWWCENEI